MAESSVVNTEWSETGLGWISSDYGSLTTAPGLGTGLGKASSNYDDYLKSLSHSHFFRWGVFENTGTLIASGQENLSAFARWVAGLQKLERQNQERLAAVYLDPTAQQLIDALDRKTSIRWEDMPDMVEGTPHDVLRSVVLLAGANLCEASPTRLRLSEYGDKLLAESSMDEQTSSEIE